MQGTIVERPLSHFVGLRIVGTYDTLGDLVPDARKQILSRQYEIQGIANAYEQLGVTRPEEHETAEGNVTTYIGFEVTDYKSVPADLVSIDLPAGRYARFDWQGSFESDEFEGFYPGIFEWFKEQGLAPSDTAPWIEVYGEQHNWDDKSDPSNRLTVLMPLAGGSP